MILKNVKIPKRFMLAKYNFIDENGKFFKRGNEKIGYAAMLDVRRFIVVLSPIVSSVAITIATRYSLLRT